MTEKWLKPFREVLEKEAFLGNKFAQHYLEYLREKKTLAQDNEYRETKKIK